MITAMLGHHPTTRSLANCARLFDATPRQFTAIYQKAEEGGYVAWVEELPGAVTQGETLEEARANLKDATELLLDVMKDHAADQTTGLDVIREPLVIDRP